MLRMDDGTEEEITAVIKWVDAHPVISDHIMTELRAYVMQDHTFHFTTVERMLNHFDYIENSEGSYG